MTWGGGVDFGAFPDGTWQYREATSGMLELVGGTLLDIAGLYTDLPP